MPDTSLDSILNEVRGFVFSIAWSHGWPQDVCDLLARLDAQIGARIPATLRHDAGAYARCSWCGRYSADPRSLSDRKQFLCDCGRGDGWSGSFVPPGRDAKWSIGVKQP